MSQNNVVLMRRYVGSGGCSLGVHQKLSIAPPADRVHLDLPPIKVWHQVVRCDGRQMPSHSPVAVAVTD